MKPHHGARRRRWLLLALLIPVAAQADDAAAAAAGATVAGTLGPLTVTARKRSERLQDVPESVAVVSGEAIEQRGLETIGALDREIANLQESDSNGVRTIYMRGAGGGGRTVGFDPRTGVYVDGVYLGYAPSVNAMLLDLERVEVLRGPQGTLFGQNTVSGALDLITRAPAETFAAHGLAAYGNGNQATLAGAVDAPLLAGRLLARTSVSYSHRDGFVRNVHDGSRVDGGDDLAGRIRLRLKLSPAAAFDLAADQSRQATRQPTGEAFSNTAGTGPAGPPDLYTVNLDTPQEDINRNSGIAGTFGWKSGDVEVVSISAYRRALRQWVVDLDYSPRAINTLDYNDRYRVLSQELRVVARQPAWNLSELGGIYVFDSHAASDRLVRAGADVKSFPPFAPFLSPGDQVSTTPRVRTRSYAAFGTLGYTPAPRWQLDAGLRLTRTLEDLEYSQTPSAGYLAIPRGPALVDDAREGFGENALTPEGAVRYAVSEQASAYLRYARGSKNGGFDADLGLRPQIQPHRFGQETVNSYELGARTLWLEQRLRLDFDVFLADYRDYQVTQYVQSGALFLPLTSNAGKVRTWGPELSASAQPLRGLNLSLDAAWLHARYAAFGNGAVSSAGVPQDYSGHRTEFSPDWTLAAAVDYRHVLPWRPDLEGIAGLGFSYRSPFFTQPSNDARLRADSRSLLDARLGLAACRGHLEAMLYAANLLDDRYLDSLNRGTLGTYYGRLGDPRSYGLRLRLSTD